MKTPKQIVMEWAVVFNGYDAAAAAALYHDDATNIQVAWGEPVQGRQAMPDTFTAILRAFPDSHTEIEHIFEDGEWVIIEWSFGGTFRDEFAGHAPTSRSFTLPGCEFFQVTTPVLSGVTGIKPRGSHNLDYLLTEVHMTP